MIIQRMTLVASALVALSVAGCANGTGSEAGTVPAGAPAAETPSSAPVPSAVPTPASPSGSAKQKPGAKPGAKPPAASGSRTISGRITAGVEPNCLLLGDNLLVIDQESLRAKAKVGAEVTVTGRAEPGMMSTCQQGTPFMVTTIRAN
ncbi:hypothetical protein AB0M36_32870 [Actinoplanes sp. NPDC051346]|uniref:hypothetical protein n=1 Tax=Actinoplanes sp. NPDC051346 TaxID=3155048 RepID=UPI0034306CED